MLDRDYSIKRLKGKKDSGRAKEIGNISGRNNGKAIVPISLDQIIDPSSTKEAINQKELILDFIECLMPRLKTFEREVFNHYYVMGCTHEEASNLLMVSRQYVTQTLKRIESKIERLKKTYRF